MTEATASPSPAKAGIWEDFIDIFYQPSQVFERRRDGKFGMALLALVILSGVLFLALKNGLAPVMDAEMAKAAAAMAAKNPQITADQIAAQQAMMEKFAVIGYVLFMRWLYPKYTVFSPTSSRFRIVFFSTLVLVPEGGCRMCSACSMFLTPFSTYGKAGLQT